MISKSGQLFFKNMLFIASRRNLASNTQTMNIQFALDAHEQLKKDNISAEVIDLRSLHPLHFDTISKSVKNTHHSVVVENGNGAEICAQVVETDTFACSDAPLFYGVNILMPYAASLESNALQTAAFAGFRPICNYISYRMLHTTAFNCKPRALSWGWDYYFHLSKGKKIPRNHMVYPSPKVLQDKNFLKYSDLNDEFYNSLGDTKGPKYLSKGVFSDSPFPIKGYISDDKQRLMVCLLLKSHRNIHPIHIWFAVDTGAPHTYLAESAIEELYGKGRNAHENLYIETQKKGTLILCSHEVFSLLHVNLLGQNALRTFNLSIKIDWQNNIFFLNEN